MTEVAATSQTNGISNMATGSFTGGGAAVSAMVGFRPRRIELTNMTDGIQYMWQEGMAAGKVLKTVAAGTVTVETGSLLAPTTNESTFHGFTIAAAAAVAAKDYVFAAFG